MAFADGHVQRWRWLVPKRVTVTFGGQPVPEEERADYERVRSGVRQRWD
ncbi:MAG: hypothetical protein ACK45B_14505 [Limisphaerales bacterium]